MTGEVSFADVPVEPDTRVTAESAIQVDGLEAIHEKWSWEGVRAKSLIYLACDVDDLDDAQLESLAKQSGLAKLDSQFTVKRSPRGFTFVNFDFES